MIGWTQLEQWTYTNTYNSVTSETEVCKSYLTNITALYDYDVIRVSANWTTTAKGTSTSNNLFYVRFYPASSGTALNMDYKNPPTAGATYISNGAFLFYKISDGGDDNSTSAQGRPSYTRGSTSYASLKNGYFCIAYRNCSITSNSITFTVEGKNL